MATALKKALINTAIGAAALPLCFVLKGWFSVLPFAVFVWFAPLVIGSWYCVSVESAAKKQGVPPNYDRNRVLKGSIVFAVVLGTLLTIGLCGAFGIAAIAIYLPLYCIEYFLLSLKTEEKQIQPCNEQQSAVEIIDYKMKG
ncbi:MAG: hypothetical protein IKH90_01095 [Ruminococcus sp.]|nr:hypothetical protein [Ruminococcus sp.]